MTRRSWLLLTLTAAVIAALALWPRSKSVEAVQVMRGNLSQSVVATGRVIPPARIDIGALLTANIAAIHAWEGEQVTAGTPLITLTDPGIEAALTQAQASLLEAEQRLTQLTNLSQPVAERTLTQAQANLSLAQAEFERKKTLVERRLMAPSTLDEARRTLHTTQASVDTARLQRDALRPGGIEHTLAQTRLQQAQAALAAAQAKADNLRILAPTDGVIISRTAEVGSTAQPGKPLMTLASQGETRVEIAVDEKSLSLLTPGQNAQLLADAFPQRPFTGELTYLSAGVDAQRATITARITIPSPPDFLRPDMTVTADMRIGQVDNALILPKDAIRDPDSKTPWALVVDAQGVTQRRDLQLGLNGVGQIEIQQGLYEGEWVITQPGITAGTRVSPKARDLTPVRGFEAPAGIAK